MSRSKVRVVAVVARPPTSWPTFGPRPGVRREAVERGLVEPDPDREALGREGGGVLGSNHVTCSRVTVSGSGCPSGPRRSLVQASVQSTTDPVVKARPSASSTSSSPPWSAIAATRRAFQELRAGLPGEGLVGRVALLRVGDPGVGLEDRPRVGRRGARPASVARRPRRPAIRRRRQPRSSNPRSRRSTRRRSVARGRGRRSSSGSAVPPRPPPPATPPAPRSRVDVLGPVVGQARDPRTGPARRRGRGRARTARGRGRAGSRGDAASRHAAALPMPPRPTTIASNVREAGSVLTPATIAARRVPILAEVEHQPA